MKYPVSVVPAALRDMQGIYDFILDREGPARAEKILDGLEAAVLSLSRQPRRGHTPPELVGMGLKQVLEIHFKPYRIIYEASATDVTVLIVADGRRDLRDLLTQRTLR